MGMIGKKGTNMTREQKLEQELAEYRKAKNLLLDRVDDAGKKSEKEKAQLYDDAVALTKAWVEQLLTGAKEWPESSPAGAIGGKAIDAILGPDGLDLLRKVAK